jgi:HSP20 family protein
MSIMKWKQRDPFYPLSDFEKLQNEINRLFEIDRYPSMTGLFDRVMSPEIDVIENEDSFLVSCDLPGVDIRDIEVSLADNVLTVKGEKKEERSSKESKVYRRESWSGSFQRTLSLPKGVDTGAVDAVMRNGVLTITLPKREEVKPKQIAVKVQ